MYLLNISMIASVHFKHVSMLMFATLPQSACLANDKLPYMWLAFSILGQTLKDTDKLQICVDWKCQRSKIFAVGLCCTKGESPYRFTSSWKNMHGSYVYLCKAQMLFMSSHYTDRHCVCAEAVLARTLHLWTLSSSASGIVCPSSSAVSLVVFVQLLVFIYTSCALLYAAAWEDITTCTEMVSSKQAAE